MLKNLKITQSLAIGFGSSIALICATFVVAVSHAPIAKYARGRLRLGRSEANPYRLMLRS